MKVSLVLTISVLGIRHLWAAAFRQRSFGPHKRLAQRLSRNVGVPVRSAEDKRTPTENDLATTTRYDKLNHSARDTEERWKRTSINLNSFDKQLSKVHAPLAKITPVSLGHDNLSTGSIHPWISFELHMNQALCRHSRFLQKPCGDTAAVNRLRKRAEAIGYALEMQLETSPTEKKKRSFHLRPLPKQQTPERAIDLNERRTISTYDSATINIARSNDEIVDFGTGSPTLSPVTRTSDPVTPASSPTAANSLGFSIESHDVGYFVEIKVGTPPKPFKVIVDSGSSDFWLPAPQCRNLITGAFGCQHSSLSTESTSLKMSTTPFKIAYGTGQVAGVLVQETVDVAGLQLLEHTFGGATIESNEFAAAHVPFDGLMGTGKSLISSQRLLTPIETLAKVGTVPGAFMGYVLGRAGDRHNIGQVTFGGVDQSKFNGPLTLFKSTSNGFWEAPLSHAAVDGQTVLTNRAAILDTGTSLMVLPPDDAEAIHAAIPGSNANGHGGFTVPCNNKAIVALGFGGKQFSIRPSDIAFQPLNPYFSNGDCISGISAGNLGGRRQWLVGDVFLKNVYFATDATNNQIGLAGIKSDT